jgi:uncharacterized protein YihD (DUF1040 family)
MKVRPHGDPNRATDLEAGLDEILVQIIAKLNGFSTEEVLDASASVLLAQLKFRTATTDASIGAFDLEDITPFLP